jgi:hypothetical protein
MDGTFVLPVEVGSWHRPFRLRHLLVVYTGGLDHQQQHGEPDDAGYGGSTAAVANSRILEAWRRTRCRGRRRRLAAVGRHIVRPGDDDDRSVG